MSEAIGEQAPTEVLERRKIQYLSASKAKTALTCLRLFKYRYEDRKEVLGKEEALTFGTLIDRGLQAWWGSLAKAWTEDESSGDVPDGVIELPKLDIALPLRNAIAEMRRSGNTDPYVLVKAEELVIGYDVRWLAESVERWEVLGVEEGYDVPLVNPVTKAASRTWRLRGWMDVLLRDGSTGDIWIREGKTSSRDISPGAEYWEQLRMDVQVSMYYAGLMGQGMEPRGCMYDVIGKPGQIPLKATPIKDRKYREPKDRSKPPREGTKAREDWEALRPEQRVDERMWQAFDDRLLHADQRLVDEEPEAYRLRVRKAIAADPDKYYQRQTVVRLERDMQMHLHNMVMLGRSLRDCQLADLWPQNPTACMMWNRRCAFFDVCVGSASLDDPTRFKSMERREQTVAQAAEERARANAE